MFSLRLENINSNIVDINDGIRYVVLSITGLNPPSASIFTAKSPNRKGLKYNGSTLNERNIVVTIKILGDIEANRNALYEWIDTEQYCKVYYRNGTKNVYCEGHIQECEIDYFTDNEVVELAILCENPYWKDLQEISTEISNLLKQFTFPFAISNQRSYTVSTKKVKSFIDENTTDIYEATATDAMTVSAGIPFSTIRQSNTTVIFNTGAETGVLIRIKCNADIENLIIYNADNTAERFAFNVKLLEDWIVEIDTENSPKTVKVIKPDGTVESLLKNVANNPTWFTLKKGANKFSYAATSGIADVEITIGYENKYLGV